MIRPYAARLGRYERQGYIALVSSVDELARKIDVDAVNLDETIRRNNEYARTGIDPDFGRGTNPLNTVLMGDPDHKPNPCLGPIDTSRLVALRMHPATLGTCIGLSVDSEARVLDSEGRVIEGLYACGQDVSSVMRGHYPGAGINIGPAIVFAYIAARHASRHWSSRAVELEAVAVH